MAENTYRYYKDLPPWAKGVVIVGGFALVGYVVIRAYNSIKASKDKKEALELADDAQNEINQLKAKGIRPTYTQPQYVSFADKIVIALDSCGSDEQSVYNVFNAMKNKADVLNLISAFGVKYYQPCAATNPISYTRYLVDSKTFGGNLSVWLSFDLTRSEISKINKILEDKKIDYKF